MEMCSGQLFSMTLECKLMRQIFEGHTHYIMALAINPKDPQTFASACLDHTVKVWSLGNPVPNFSLEAHEKGVNYVDYYHGGDRPYMVTTGDDRYVLVTYSIALARLPNSADM